MCIVDPSKLLYINILVLVLFKSSAKPQRKEFIERIKQMPNITSIISLDTYADFAIEFSVNNLSMFNKILVNLDDEFSEVIKIISMHPIIVRHIFSRKYLNKRSKTNTDSIILGDRKPVSLSDNASRLLFELIKKPNEKIINLSENLKLNV